MPLNLPSTATSTTVGFPSNFSVSPVGYSISVPFPESTVDAVWTYQLTAQLDKILPGTLESNFRNRYLFKDRPATPRAIGSPIVGICEYEEQIVS